MSMQLVFSQILVIILYIAVGFGAGKLKLILPDQRKFLSALCSHLILPFTILSATAREVGRQELMGAIEAMLIMLAVYAATTVITLLWCRFRGVTGGMRAALTGLLTYSNCTFLGLPLCKALFGDIAMLYNASALVAFNGLFFLVQEGLFMNRPANVKNLLTPSLMSVVALMVMLALGLHFPAPLQTVISGIGSMVSPLSLIIIGVMLSENRIAAVLGEKRSYIVTLLRNIVIPLAAIPLLRLLPVPPVERLCALVYIACPCATLSSIYAIRCDAEPVFSANTVLLSTLLFALSLPAVIWAGQALL